MRLEWGCFGLILASTFSEASSLPGSAHTVNKSNHSDRSHRNDTKAEVRYMAGTPLPKASNGVRFHNRPRLFRLGDLSGPSQRFP